MGALGREERRQVDRVGAERLDPVQMLLDPGQVTAEELAVGVARPHLRSSVPVATERPVGGSGPPGSDREPIDEDLVDDGGEVPIRFPRLGRQLEVVGRRHLAGVGAAAVDPPIAEPAAGQQPPIREDRVAQRHLDVPPRLAVTARPRGRLDGARLAVAHVPQEHRIGTAVRDANTKLRGIAEVLDVELRAIVVGVGEAGGRRTDMATIRADPPILRRGVAGDADRSPASSSPSPHCPSLYEEGALNREQARYWNRRDENPRRRHTRLQAAVAGGSLMARPGLEPGTPRFSVVQVERSRRVECLEITRFSFIQDDRRIS